ncbi:MAG: TetR/AcrR family transcriptional regulator, partial [Catenulispora sp.]|nr:TetR/AcrR family transcriptional regulator [Catenulispora sp.]
MGRTSDARERLLAAGTHLLGQRPYSSVGVAEICATAGVPKGSFYYFFPSKQDLALAVIDEHWEHQRKQWAAVLGGTAPADDRIHELFRASARVQQTALADSGAVVGCLFGNLALELSSTEDTVRTRLQEIFEAQVQMIDCALADDDGYAGVSDESRRRLSASVVAQLEGSVLFAKLFQDPAQIETHWESVA